MGEVLSYGPGLSIDVLVSEALVPPRGEISGVIKHFITDDRLQWYLSDVLLKTLPET